MKHKGPTPSEIYNPCPECGRARYTRPKYFGSLCRHCTGKRRAVKNKKPRLPVAEMTYEKLRQKQKQELLNLLTDALLKTRSPHAAAEHLDMSHNHFYHMFRNYSGKSPTAFLEATKGD